MLGYTPVLRSLCVCLSADGVGARSSRVSVTHRGESDAASQAGPGEDLPALNPHGGVRSPFPGEGENTCDPFTSEQRLPLKRPVGAC